MNTDKILKPETLLADIEGRPFVGKIISDLKPKLKLAENSTLQDFYNSLKVHESFLHRLVNKLKENKN